MSGTVSDLAFVLERQQKTIIALTLMHSTIQRIANEEHSRDAGPAMKALAADTLITLGEMFPAKGIQYG